LTAAALDEGPSQKREREATNIDTTVPSRRSPAKPPDR